MKKQTAILITCFFLMSCSGGGGKDQSSFGQKGKGATESSQSSKKPESEGRETSFNLLNLTNVVMKGEGVAADQVHSTVTKALKSIPKAERKRESLAAGVAQLYTRGFYNIQQELGDSQFAQTPNLLKIFAKASGNFFMTPGNTNGFAVALASQVLMELSFLRADNPNQSHEWIQSLWVGASSPKELFKSSLWDQVINGAFSGLLTYSLAQFRKNPTPLFVLKNGSLVSSTDQEQIRKIYRNTIDNVPQWIESTFTAWTNVFKGKIPGESWIIQTKNFAEVAKHVLTNNNASQEEYELVERLLNAMKKGVEESIPNVTEKGAYLHAQKKMKVSVTGSHACTIQVKSQTAKCWGRNKHGQTGQVASEKAQAPQTVEGLEFPRFISVGDGYSCAVDKVGLKCWGAQNLTTGCGTGCVGGSGSHSPQTLLSDPNIKALSTGPFFGCVVDGQSQLKCWGKDLSSFKDPFQFGFQATPKDVGLNGVVDVKVNYLHYCALKSNGDLFCAGDNSELQTGLGEGKKEIKTPQKILSDVARFSLFPRGGCAIMKSGSEFVKCWGKGSANFVSNGRSPQPTTPNWAKRLKARPKELFTSTTFFCLLDPQHNVTCWDSIVPIEDRRPTLAHISEFSSATPSVNLKNPYSENVCFQPQNPKVTPVCSGTLFPNSLQIRETDGVKYMEFTPIPLKIKE